MNKLEQAAQQILEALEGIGFVSDYWNEKVTALREALAEPELNLNCKSVQKRLATSWGYVKAEQAEQEPVAWRVRGYNQFKTGNPAPWRYVDGADKPTVNKPDCCDFEPLYAAPVQQAEQEPFDMNDHPPHRLCECRKCMEYFTPLPDCDAFAAFGKPIAEQTNTQFMEGYRIGLAEMREKCAKVCDEWNWSSKHGSNPSGQLAVLAAAIRARGN